MAELSPEDCRDIVRKHLHSSSMISIFLMQDLLALSKDFRYNGDVTREDINHPDVPEWNWKYHMHISLE